MRFRIEYLTESTKESSVCATIEIEADHPEEAAEAARAGLARIQGPIDGYQIRHLDGTGPVVLLRHLYP